MKKKILIFVGGIILFIGVIVGLFFYLMTPVGGGIEKEYFTINNGDKKDVIATNLKEEGFVRSKYATLFYIVLKGNMQAGTYLLDQNDSVFDIVGQIASGDTRIYAPTKRVKIIEGLRLEDMAEILASNLNFTKEEFMSVCDDDEVVKSLIEKYDFITKDVLDDKIYHPLEGYLAPDTYEFYEESTPLNVISVMLNNMEKRLDGISSELKKSEFSIHEVLTLASIIELEGAKEEDRRTISQVFLKRLDENIALGSDVTTYYGASVKLGDYISDHLADVNGYNTRNNDLIGLPVGPICSPSLMSIKAVFNPTDTDYLYFAADVNTGKVYFAKNDSEWIVLLRKLGLR